MTQSLRFPAALRLHGERQFGRVFAARQSAGNGIVVVYAGRRPADQPVPQGLPAVRLGLSVSRRVGQAVHRNRWKRRIREAFRHLQHDLPSEHDYVVVVRRSELPSAGDMEVMLLALARRAVGRSRAARADDPRRSAGHIEAAPRGQLPRSNDSSREVGR